MKNLGTTRLVLLGLIVGASVAAPTDNQQQMSPTVLGVEQNAIVLRPGSPLDRQNAESPQQSQSSLPNTQIVQTVVQPHDSQIEQEQTPLSKTPVVTRVVRQVTQVERKVVMREVHNRVVRSDAQVPQGRIEPGCVNAATAANTYAANTYAANTYAANTYAANTYAANTYAANTSYAANTYAATTYTATYTATYTTTYTVTRPSPVKSLNNKAKISDNQAELLIRAASFGMLCLIYIAVLSAVENAGTNPGLGNMINGL